MKRGIVSGGIVLVMISLLASILLLSSCSSGAKKVQVRDSGVQGDPAGSGMVITVEGETLDTSDVDVNGDDTDLEELSSLEDDLGVFAE